jgi:ribosome recycling factor
LAIPSLTEERRLELVKLVHRRAEEAKVAIRNCRRDALEDLREFEKEKLVTEDEFYSGRDDLQELTTKYNERVEEIEERKEREIKEI